LTTFAEERHPTALDVYGDERVVGRGQVLRREGNVVAFVAAHGDRHIARAISRVPAVLIEARDAHFAELTVCREGTEGRAAIDAQTDLVQAVGSRVLADHDLAMWVDDSVSAKAGLLFSIERHVSILLGDVDIRLRASVRKRGSKSKL
jgi:hypothetical protein